MKKCCEAGGAAALFILSFFFNIADQIEAHIQFFGTEKMYAGEGVGRSPLGEAEHIWLRSC
jgi:hypothetical protein